MGPVFETARAFVKNVTEVFGKADGERSKCPRCKGSGLLAGRSWGWGSPSSSNAPCWFCEGVGVMSIVGLNGYILGRSSAIVNTRDIKDRPGMPVNFQLYTGKYPGAKCKLSSYKPSEGMLSDPRLHDVELEDAMGRPNHIGSDELPYDSTEFKDLPSWTFMSPEHSGIQYQHRFYARTGFSFGNPKAAATHLSQPEKLHSRLPAQPFLNSRENSGRKNASVNPLCPIGMHFLEDHSGTGYQDLMEEKAADSPRSSEYVNLNDHSRALSSMRSRPRAGGARALQFVEPAKLVSDHYSRPEIGGDSIDGTPKVRSSRRHSLSRRTRNRIREEAGKEAMARARKVQERTQKLESASITLDPLVGSLVEPIHPVSNAMYCATERLLHDDNTESEYQDLVGLGLKSVKSHHWLLSRTPGKGLNADLSFMNKLLYKKAKDILLCHPNIAKQ